MFSTCVHVWLQSWTVSVLNSLSENRPSCSTVPLIVALFSRVVHKSTGWLLAWLRWSHGLWGRGSDTLTDYFLLPHKPCEVSSSPENAETTALWPNHRGTPTHAQPISSSSLTAEVMFGATERSGELWQLLWVMGLFLSLIKHIQLTGNLWLLQFWQLNSWRQMKLLMPGTYSRSSRVLVF